MKRQVQSLWKMTRRTMLACLLLLACWRPAMAQTSLAAGDVICTGFNATAVSTVKTFQFVLLKNIASGTVFKFTSAAFLSGSTSGTSSNVVSQGGVCKWTAGAAYSAGQVINVSITGTTSPSSDIGTMANVAGSGAPANAYSNNTTAGKVFIYYSPSGDGNGSGQDYSGTSGTVTFQGTPVSILGYQGSTSGYTTWLSSGSATGRTSYLPSDMASYNVFFAGNATGGYYNGARSGASAAAIRTAVLNSANWTTVTGSSTATIPTGNFSLGTIPSFTGSTTLNACSAGTAVSINSNLALSDAAASGTTETYTILASPTHGTLGGFSTTATTSGGTATPSGCTYTPTSGYTGSDAFSIKVSNGSGSDTQAVTVTVNASPNPGTIVTTQDSFCATAAQNYIARGGAIGGVWTSANTSIATVALTGDTVSTVTGIYSGSTMPLGGNTTITYTSSTVSCGTTSSTKQVYIRPFSDTGSTRTPASGTIICTGATVTATSNSVTDGLPRYNNVRYGHTWTTQNSSIASVNPSTGVIIGRAAGTVNITYTTAPNGCGSFNTRRSIVVQTTPSAGTISGGSSVCAGATVSLSSSGTSGGTWTSDNTSIASVNSSSGLVYGVAAGSANISYTVTSGSCGTFMASQAVTVNSAGSPGTISGASSVCTGATTSYSTSGSGGNWSTTDASVASVNAASGLVYGVSAGSATISYTVTGCGSGSTSQGITVNTGGSVGTLSGTTTVCTGATTAFSTSGSGGTWSSSSTGVATVNTSGTVYGVSAGSATITYTVTGCGAGTATRGVTVNTTPDAGIISGASSVCTGASTALTSSGATGGTWSSSASSTATVNTSGSVYGVVAGSATISYTVSTACGTDVATQAMTVNTAASAGTLSGASSVCESSSASVSTSGTGGTWSSSNTSVASVDGSGSVYGVAAGSATISYSVSGACGTGTATRSFTVNPILSAGTISGGSSVCIGSTLPLSASGDAGGSWSSSTTSVATVGTLGVVHPGSAGTTTITYTVSSACGTSTATQSVTVNPLPDAGSLSGASGVCVSASAMLTSSGATGGSWSSSNTARATVSTSGNVTGIGAGGVTISYSVTNGCGTDVATQAMTVNPLPNAGTLSGASSVCVAASTSLSSSGSTGGTWSSSASGTATVSTSGNVTGVAAGSATLSYTATNSCGTDVATQSITVNPLPNAGSISGVAIICETGAVTMSTSGTGGGSWSVSSASIATLAPRSATATDVYGLSAGFITISYSLTNGCGTDVATHGTTVLALPHAGTLSGGPTVCLGADVSYTSSGDAGGTWSSSSSSVASVNAAGTVHGVSAGSATITYTVSGSCGSDNNTRSITVNPSADAGSITGATSVCPTASTTLTASVAGGTWSSSHTGLATVSTSGDVTGIVNGSVTITYTVSTSCGTDRTTHSMTVLSLPDAGAITGAATVCEGASATLGTSGSTGGTWSTSASSIASVSASGTVFGVAPGSATISYSVTNSCGTDVATRSQDVTALPSTPGSITGTTTIPFTGGTTSLSCSPSGGTWSTSNAAVISINTSGVATAVTSGSATITYTVSNSCGSVFVTQTVTCSSSNRAPRFNASVTTVNVCASGSGVPLNAPLTFWEADAGQTMTISIVSGPAHGTARISYTTTSTGSTMIPSGLLFIPSSAHIGMDTIVARLSDGIATTTAIIRLNVVANPAAPMITGTTVLCVGASTTLTGTPSGGTWGNRDGNTSIGTTTGVLTAIAGSAGEVSYIRRPDSNGCVSAVSATISILSAPAAFTVTGGLNTICPGSSTTFTGSVGGGTWSSSAMSVATVTSGGSVTGVADGSASIVYRVSNACGSRTASKTINVFSGTSLPPIDGRAWGCVAGSMSLSNTTSGGTWSSASTSIATVGSTGVVHGVAVGTATIIYSYTNGCGVMSSVFKNVRIFPAPTTPVITGPSTVVVGSSISLSAPTTHPGGTWITTSPSIASVIVNGTVTGVSAGIDTIKYRFNDICGTVTGIKVISVTGSRGAYNGGAMEQGEGTNLYLYPNPTTGTITIDVKGGTGATEVVVTDVAGKVIMTRSSETNKLDLDLSNLAAGAYFIRVTNSGQTFVDRIVIE